MEKHLEKARDVALDTAKGVVEETVSTGLSTVKAVKYLVYAIIGAVAILTGAGVYALVA